MIVYEALKYINLTIMALFCLCYFYQIVYIIVACVKKPIAFESVKPEHRFAFMIAARNEEDVIGQLCDSIKKQNYPADLIDIYVVADNCTDSTKYVAGEHGARVFERFDSRKKGKGYALEYLFDRVLAEKGNGYYDAYFIVDADNLLAFDFVTEMDKCMSSGQKIIMCYRNSKNYADNWISSGYSLWFLRASRHLNNARFILHTSSEVSGTGFLVHRDIINRQGGWKHFSLIEDIEFTVDNVIHGEKVGYCHSAVVYDEQPTTFGQSWSQRKRWCKGYLQVLRRYGFTLIKRFLTGKGFSNFDMLMAICPAFFLTLAGFLINCAAVVIIPFVDTNYILPVLFDVAVAVVSSYLFFFAVGLVSGITEWKKINASNAKKIISFFKFPLFMFTYLPVMAGSIFSKPQWKPIKHHAVDENNRIIRQKKSGRKFRYRRKIFGDK